MSKPAFKGRFTENFAANFKYLCARSGLMQTEIAQGLGLSRMQVHRYAAGENFPTPILLEMICSFFGVSVDLLLEEKLEKRSA